MLWLKSRNSEVWLDRRTTYTRSTAVMSMVGYLLGLGDRHPSNLMLDRYSGKLLHIDFGDCFEASMNREKFPEKVPFRLTRMMERAMEVSGIEGNFRCCSAEPHTATAAAAAGAVLSAALACAWCGGLQAAGPGLMRPRSNSHACRAADTVDNCNIFNEFSVGDRAWPCRFTCENVMKVLRSNKDSVMAMLEAFVHDPLINWRLLNTTDTVPDAAMARDADASPDLPTKTSG